jgi:hypothetical protein
MARKRRRRVLVDKSTQWAIVRQSLLHWFYHSSLTIFFLLILELLLGGILRPWGETWQALWPLAAAVYVSMLLLLPTFIHDSFKLSNRIAGPVGRIRNALRDVAEGKPYRPVELRTRDFWPEMGQELDAAVKALTTRRTAEEDDFELVRS